MDAALANIDLAEQSVLISLALGGEVQLATCSSSGNILSTSSPEPAAFEQRFSAALTDLCNQPVLADNETRGPAGEAIMGTPVLSIDRGERGWVCMVITTTGTSSADNGLASALLKLLANHIGKQYENELELNAFATELSERYDELNLVYDADRTIESSHLESEILSGLVDHCINHLPVKAALVYVPDKKIEILAESTTTPSAQAAELNEICDTLLSLTSHSKSSIVLNNEEERATLGAPTSSKIMAAPIETVRGTIEGVLCVAAELRNNDFANSDRNLLEVMSRRITQVLQSSHDPLTGIFNRASFEKHVENCISMNRMKRSEHCLLNVDLDDFHVVNETYGFAYGDEIIAHVADLLGTKIRDDDVVARIGANEFGILLRNCPGDAGVGMAKKICTAISNIKLPNPNKPIDLTASIGISVLGSPLDITGDVISRAELACQEAKSRGKNTVFNPHADQGTIEERRKQVSWISVINAALAKNDFRLYAQPIERIKHRPNEVHFEVLLRLQDKAGKILSPFTFLPAAERYRLMPKIDRWVLENAFACIAEYRDRLQGKSVKAAINLSGQSLSDPAFSDFVKNILDSYDLPAEWICLEVTESAAISNIESAQQVMADLFAHGIAFSLDDFGTGLSSFEYLKNLKVNYLKIDGFFIKQIHEDPVSAAIVSAMSQVAKSMGLETIGEFVEDDSIKQQIYYLGVDFAQGYSIGKPIPLAELITAAL